MKVKHYRAVEPQPVTMEGSHGCRVRQLVGAAEAAPNFAMREFEVEPGGFTPRHSHPYEHEVFVLEGAGEVYEGDTAHPFCAGDVIYVAPDEVHQFRNTSDSPMRFLCLIPNSAANAKIMVVPECGLPTAP